MCKCFIRGLKSEIEQRIARNLSVQETVADALRIERELRSMSDLWQGHSIKSGQSKSGGVTINSGGTCQICHKEGYLATNCRKLISTSQTKSDLGTEILICQICKKRGHGADKCRFRDPQSSRSVNVMQTNFITCQLCSKPGHNAKICRSSNNVNLFATTGDYIIRQKTTPIHDGWL